MRVATYPLFKNPVPSTVTYLFAASNVYVDTGITTSTAIVHTDVAGHATAVADPLLAFTVVAVTVVLVVHLIFEYETMVSDWQIEIPLLSVIFTV